jgi:dienelactone hydrolase
MCWLFCFLVAVALGPASSAKENTPSGPEGVWVGSCQIDGIDVFVVLRLQRSTNPITGAAFSRRLGIRGAALSEGQLDGNRLALSFATPQRTIHLDGVIHNDELTGTVIAEGSSGPCAFRRRLAMDASSFDAFQGDYQLSPDHVVFIGRFDTAQYFFLVDGDVRLDIMPVGPDEFLVDDLRALHFERDKSGSVIAATFAQPGQTPQRAMRVRPYQQETIAFANGEVRLTGRLTLPSSPVPCPALVFVHGSGPGLRDAYALEADLLARHGIASLGFDKRGCGQSTGDWRQVDFAVLADDVLAAVECLRRDPRIRADKVGLFGVSQAAWIIPLAASRSPHVAFIIPVSGGAVSPAEQELWRHKHNLEFFGVPARFIELERKAAAMTYDWQRQNQVGRMPIPNFFADDNLKMFHDAPAVLRQVRQPVLAILGGMDTLTPPQESAAIWADVMRQRGDDDFSVRLFPQGTHGLLVAGKTGVPFEFLREIRWVPGYFDTLVKWIHHHVDGPPFPAARQVDVDGDSIPVQSRGMQQVSWYGSGLVQPWQLVSSFVIFSSAVLAAPAAALWRRIRSRRDSPPAGSRQTIWLAALLGLINVGILVAMTYIFYQLVQAQPHPLFEHLTLIWNSIAAASWLSILLVALVYRGCVLAWRRGWWSRSQRVYYTLVSLAGLCWLPFAWYWDLLRPTW